MAGKRSHGHPMTTRSNGHPVRALYGNAVFTGPVASRNTVRGKLP